MHRYDRNTVASPLIDNQLFIYKNFPKTSYFNDYFCL